jgi:hypothetical protein
MKLATCHPEKKHYCKGLCENCYMTQFRRSRPEYRAYMKEYLKKYREENPEKMAELYAKRRADPEKRKRDALVCKNSAYRQKYGITLAKALSLLSSQGGGCALCKIELTEKTMNVDHCHKDGHVRGILCGKCNTGLGLLGDTRDALLEAVAYLAQSGNQ